MSGVGLINAALSDATRYHQLYLQFFNLCPETDETSNFVQIP
ncbi:hypothetical protein A464_1911 [Salmonella bongori N268-08]|uniref:Uncharacterized protein n=1 Tax=Salmonella bongori N268-08 TaxID=1197719 RepID=S5MQV8_SALBN|nr:hypothetical protein A464_1911 [Salmonella bongori N268-08]